MLNLNGRDTRFDGDNASYAAVSPLGKRSGRLMQVSASHANENVYTDLWQGRFFGFRYLTTSLINTEKPIRVKPVNIYYHMYSGEKQASLTALTSVLDYAARQPLAPITATHYAAIGQGFYTLRLTAISPNAWRIENRGALNTLRFDDPGNRRVDFAASRGVMGQAFNGKTMYVSLDPSVAKVELHLSEGAASAPMRPELVASRWAIKDLKTTTSTAQFHAQGFGPGSMILRVPAGAKSERWEATLGTSKFYSSARDANGLVVFNLPRGSEEGQLVTIQRSTLRSTLQ
jgi:hypothetical protein